MIGDLAGGGALGNGGVGSDARDPPFDPTAHLDSGGGLAPAPGRGNGVDARGAQLREAQAAVPGSSHRPWAPPSLRPPTGRAGRSKGEQQQH
eukprot:1178004-Prorocentrum_minimum.AAC.2